MVARGRTGRGGWCCRRWRRRHGWLRRAITTLAGQPRRCSGSVSPDRHGPGATATWLIARHVAPAAVTPHPGRHAVARNGARRVTQTDCAGIRAGGSWHDEPEHLPVAHRRLTLRFVGEQDVAALTAYRNDPAVAALQDWELPYPRERRPHSPSVTPGSPITSPAGPPDRDRAGRRAGRRRLHRAARARRDRRHRLQPHPVGARAGVAFEAVSALIADLVERLGVHRIVRRTFQDNGPSIRLLERPDDFRAFSRANPSGGAGVGRQPPTTPCRPSSGGPGATARAPAADRAARRITEDNRWTYARVRTHRSQEHFCATVHDSYADALFPGSAMACHWSRCSGASRRTVSRRAS